MAIQMHAIIMKDKGLDKGLIREFNTSDRNKRGWAKGFFGFRKMFWEYLNKLHVPFYDDCCEEAADITYPVRWNESLKRMEKYNGTAWVDITEIVETTTTTSTSSTTTTTTTTP